MGLEKRTVGSMGISRTVEVALTSTREVGKEFSPGCAAWSAEPEGFKRRWPSICCLQSTSGVLIALRPGVCRASGDERRDGQWDRTLRPVEATESEALLAKLSFLATG